MGIDDGGLTHDGLLIALLRFNIFLLKAACTLEYGKRGYWRHYGTI
ncbi:hypothetical protein HMPREF9098_2398 [Kingella denitrificans ATCC 33394]|uniref:Uncharacterized protein n=1 Tax=Kingella denitrificans ATCC 33394 TaxID=888741 RepID=F0F2R3_9NEIS|nr:hypothetical protein HMPREF9098_2398 [Kingella denitrificans ATCC 33394]